MQFGNVKIGDTELTVERFRVKSLKFSFH